MPDILQQQKEAIIQWSAQAKDKGWLGNEDLNSLEQLSLAAPDRLFEQLERPLVVGFFGGTGVGKSSLLNRLASEPIARASAERPTSRDITVYVHRSVSVDRLPTEFPMHRMRTALHSKEQFEQIMFIDMPDFDSVDSSNRELVNIWLPHLDIVLYVVSPERYRDDQGWRLLLEHAPDHGWLFIFNHWDRGSIEQFEDFSQQLAAAGLTDPLVYKTDCSTPTDANNAALSRHDDFDDLQQRLIALSERKIVLALNEHGTLARLQALKTVADQCLARVADESQCSQLRKNWLQESENNIEAGRDNLRWSFIQVAQRYATPARRWWQLSRASTESASAAEGMSQEPVTLMQDQFDRQLDNFINQHAHALQIPVNAMKLAIESTYTQEKTGLPQLFENQLNQSLASPGQRWHRYLYRALGALCVLLPAAAMLWIAFRVINGFVNGANDPSAYLGSNFAINAAMLIAIAWLAPAFLQSKCTPSNEAAALRGLNRGYELSHERLSEAVSTALEALETSARQSRQSFADAWTRLPHSSDHPIPESVKRLIVDQMHLSGEAQSLARGLDVRANTHKSTDSAPVS